MFIRSKRLQLTVIAIGLLAWSPIVMAQSTEDAVPSQTADEWPEAWFEIFKLAPGKHAEFIRLLELHDRAAAAAGLPATQIFFHSHGADWDVLLLKPVDPEGTTAEQDAIIEAKSRELGIPTGPDYFNYLRTLTSSHTDSKTIGPITAAQWLARLTLNTPTE